MRRRQKLRTDSAGNVLTIPPSLTDFVPEDWPGKSEHQRWAAWSEARYSWAEENLPDGYEDMPSWPGVVPDQPWSEAKREL